MKHSEVLLFACFIVSYFILSLSLFYLILSYFILYFTLLFLILYFYIHICSYYKKCNNGICCMCLSVRIFTSAIKWCVCGISTSTVGNKIPLQITCFYFNYLLVLWISSRCESLIHNFCPRLKTSYRPNHSLTCWYKHTWASFLIQCSDFVLKKHNM